MRNKIQQWRQVSKIRILLQHPEHLTNQTDTRRRTTSEKVSLTVGAWNVCTINDSDFSVRAERATALICREFEKANIDIRVRTEVRRSDKGNIVYLLERRSRHNIIAGVIFAISS